ncbi:MBL fold metallo-hydrolase, partial [Actinocrinis sp.]|uniref:MBL fold metallo-hydrolase n=1 Tax=Actinocrinis sp. TaxID=1920516 RepID=UPI002D6D30D2
MVDTARRRKLLRLGVLVLIGALVAGAVALVRQAAAPAWPPRDWSMAVCDVGQGDALLLHTGPASAIAVDTGPEPAREDACLRRFGITNLPLVILTHFHEDH